MSESVTANDLLSQVPKTQGPPPVHLWNPPFCGNLDMRIARDGTWYYQGTPITRQAMVRLFSTVLKREGTGWFLVTPVEKVGIQVEDAPFVVVLLSVEGQGDQQSLNFTDNVGNCFTAGPDHPLRVETDEITGEPAPYVRVRGDLDALVNRNVFYQLVELAEVREVRGQKLLGVTSGGAFFSLGEAP
jgi:hypothetical protein